ncbi:MULTISPECIES: 2-dehydropantoate 2-reductase [unclassified Enterococcus]|uniref:ketopantoate reductase family protein n=1 Tax=unclassified Enterococcus TaxID=2608891 RepID=UPI0015553CCE|nr:MULTISPECIES: 2-dehydropantoate 2-reductase [unclassified Enterococcus]MBS7576904.1 2-dehydropantoate 2-reductase [Enterococcus sp. MMGLQ5-2]MBS7584311.1 2-dehydropantoate 2-reductase [Enterococcus sp. MMGLQ5-1]NPD12167.1 2-dehydropantoate 2-reductase [Enterococcus sp. MMGLQ5-1]NPD36739.1 2-dehydropantoate 2-reductase [Enterococcus sp. MMGLQ5-2]
MKIAIVGAGAMGSMIAAYLKKGGAEVSLIAPLKGNHAMTIKQKGLNIISHNESEIVPIDVVTSYKNLPTMDYVIILVKGTVTNNVLKDIQPIVGTYTFICTLQNGLGNEELIAHQYGEERTLYGCLNMSSVIQQAGVIAGELFEGVNIYLGSITKKRLQQEACEVLAACFENGGVRTSFDEKQIDLNIWNKLMMNIVINAPLALLRIQVGEACRDEKFIKLAKHLVEETIKIAYAKNICELDKKNFFEKTLPSVAETAKNHFPSMAQDMIIHRNQTEIENLNGAISRLGKEFNIPTPYNDTITMLVKIYENHYDKQYI